MDVALIASEIAKNYTKQGTGVPSRIGDSDLVQCFLECVLEGNYIETAADVAGLSKVTVYDWIKRGEAGDIPFNLFAVAMKRASAQAEREAVKNVRTAGKEGRNWAAEMTFLERRLPEKWARRSEDSAGPKVVVQIGVRDSDVQVSIQGQPAQLAIGSGEHDA
jgi:transposase